MSWSVLDYIAELRNKGVQSNRRNDDLEAEMRWLFPPVVNYKKLYEPAVITDWDGRILLWYLPGILSHLRRVSISHQYKWGRL